MKARPRKRHVDILVVDDKEEVRCPLTAVLRSQGYVVEQASNGYEALLKLRNLIPRLILLDLRMPKMDGWKFLAIRSRLKSLAKIPVIVVSGEEKTPKRVEAVVKKPVNVSALSTLLKRYSV